jgi:hypothetical protein
LHRPNAFESVEIFPIFLTYPLLRVAVPIVKQGEIEFNWHGKIAALPAQNAHLTQEIAFPSDQSLTLTRQIGDLEKKILPAEMQENLLTDIPDAAYIGDTTLTKKHFSYVEMSSRQNKPFHMNLMLTQHRSGIWMSLPGFQTYQSSSDSTANDFCRRR